MKTAEEWVKENTQSGAFDCVFSIEEAVKLVKKIQDDAREELEGQILEMGEALDMYET